MSTSLLNRKAVRKEALRLAPTEAPNLELPVEIPGAASGPVDPNPDATTDGYALYRGRCRELSEAACAEDPTLTLVRGHYYCPIWNSEEPHWWTRRPDGTIYDPTREQFPSRGLGIYTPFDGNVHCSNCGRSVPEAEASYDSRYAFCSTACHGHFVGVF